MWGWEGFFLPPGILQQPHRRKGSAVQNEIVYDHLMWPYTILGGKIFS